MSRAANCGLDKQAFPSQFRLNEIGTNVATAFILFTCLFYGYNIVALFRQIAAALPNQPRQRRHRRPDWNINPLSALLTAAFGVVIIFATWPQPLEGAGLLLMVLAQASALGWQDHDPERPGKDLFEKLPDVAAIVVAAYALNDGRTRYLELNPDNGFYFFHDPRNQWIFADSLTAACCAIGVLQEVLVKVADRNDTKKRILMWCSFLIFFSQLLTVSLATGFGATTIPDGCALFNATKVAAIVTLGIGVFYSALLWVMRTKLFPVA